MTTIGIAVDVNDYWGPSPTVPDAAAFRADCRIWKRLGIAHVLMLSGSADRADELLAVADDEGVTVAVGGQEEVLPFVAGSGPDTQAEADRVVSPVAAILAAHPSVDAVYVADEPTVDMVPRLQKVVDAYRRLLPGVPCVSALIGLGRAGTIQQSVGFDRLLLTAYPVGATSAEGDLLMSGFGYPNLHVSDYVRRVQVECGEPKAGPHAPLWLIGQAHNARFPGAPSYDLRTPTAAEMAQQYAEARALGADRLYWFIWHSRTGDVGWTGLEDLPALRTAIAELDGHVGVPRPTIDTSLSLDAWWDAHPFNVESASYRPTVKIPESAIDIDVSADHGGSLALAIAAAYAAVGRDGHVVLWLGDATYDASGVNPVNFAGLAKNNVQVRAKAGTSPVISGELRLVPCDEARAYHSGTTIGGKTYATGWSEMAAFNTATAVDDPANPARKLTAREVIWSYPISGWYFRGIAFDGLGGTENVSVSTCRDIVFDACTFRNVVSSGTHTGHVNGNSGTWNIWLRDCVFRGRWPSTTATRPQYAVYLDGLQMGGLLGCASDAGAFDKGDFLALVNDDFTRDYDGDGVLSLAEQRMAQYVAIVDLISGGDDAGVSIMGRHWLVKGLRKTGPSYAWCAVLADSKGNYVSSSGVPKAQYEYTDGNVRDCYVANLSASIYFYRENALAVPAQFQPSPDPLIGQHTIRGNVVDDAGFSRWVLIEGNAPAHVGPNVVEDNAASGLPAPTIPWTPTIYPYLDHAGATTAFAVTRPHAVAVDGARRGEVALATAQPHSCTATVTAS